MVDPVNDVCVCRPEFTQVGDLCIPNDEVDASVDAGPDAQFDAPTDSTTTLTVVSTEPEHNDVRVEPGSAITITFNAEVDIATLSNIALRLNDEDVASETTWDAPTLTATITPANRLDLLSDYELTIGAAVATETGVSLGVDTSVAFQTRDGEWSDPSLLEMRGDDALQARPVVATPANGGVVCWRQADSLWCSTYDEGEWSDAETVSTDDSVLDPTIARGADESVMVLWQQGSEREIFAAQHRDTWSAAEPVGASGRPVIGADDSGGFVAAWTGLNLIGASRFDPDSGWIGLSEQTLTDSPAELSFAVGASGDTVALWRDGSRFGGSIVASRYVAAGWTAVEVLSRATADEVSAPSAVFDTTGVARTVWTERRDSTAYAVVFASFNPATGWSVGQEIDEADDWALLPVVSRGPDTVLLTFCIYRDEYRARRFSQTTSWRPIESVGPAAGCGEASSDAGDAFLASHGTDRSGRSIVVYANGLTELFWSRRTELGWSTPELLEMGAEPIGNARIDVHPSGRAIATWIESDGTRYNVWARVFE